jgi:ATP-dependent RNA helicase DeaD
MSTFESLGLSQSITEAVSAIGFESPTSIQEQAIPRLLSGEEDFVGLAQTGTGKTAAFGLPLLHRTDVALPFVQSLVLAPTRELCLQICRELESFAKNQPNLRILPVYGGADIRRQIKALEQGVQVLVATPGRLRDLMRRGKVD